jgi:ribonuclease BN (tRNA processing enzyme)
VLRGARILFLHGLLLSWGLSPGFAGAQEAAKPATLELVVLGSGGPGAVGRASSSYLALIDGVPRILIDAGSGAFVKLGETKLPLAQTDIVLLTHLHADHAAELPGLFKARSVSSGAPIVFKIYGPDGSSGGSRGAYFPSTSRFVDLLFGAKGAFAYLKDFAAPVTFEPHDIHASTVDPRTILNQGGLVVAAVAGHHGDAPAIIYRIDYAGKSITFSGDIDRNGLPALRRIAAGTDLLVFNCVVLDPPGSAQILYTLHTPPHAIGEAAQAAGVRSLLLSHLSPSTDDNRDAVLQSVHQSYPGPARMAEDGLRLRP